MLRGLHLQAGGGVVALMCFVIGVAAWVLFTGEAKRPELSAASKAALRNPTGYPQLVSVAPLPTMDGEMCQWMPASASTQAAEAKNVDALIEAGDQVYTTCGVCHSRYLDGAQMGK